ncbi:polysaccharide lyase 8 family protein [Catellatospora paridis]|uniref:polysaccharide lyase 8 family protein n=1 Tax=Catellatospora paridis TaxID=1617086 RepID=UPI0012D3CDB7|nr:polysaccharide lyase 8 family protein [Catellatospora paridis]
MAHPSLSRRRLLQAAGVTAAATGAGALLPGPAHAADEYDTLRLRWRDMLLGTGYDPADPLYAGRLATRGADAAAFRSTMAPTSASLWPDLPYTASNGDQVSATYSRLKTMAMAYAQPGTGLTGDPALAVEIVAGLDHVHANVYNASFNPNGNWWWNTQIGSAHHLTDLAVIMYDHLSAAQLANYTNAVFHFVPDSRVATYSGTSTSANRVDLCRSILMAGLLVKNSAKMTLARDALSPVFPLVTTSDGFYADGSFIQHVRHPYAGSYGAVLLGGLANLFALLAGSTWAVTDPNRQLVFDAVEKTFAPFLYCGLVMDGVSGRAISRETGDHVRGHGIIDSIAVLAQGAGAAERNRWKGLVKGWLQRDYYLPYTSNANLGVPALARLRAIVADPAVTALAEPVANRVFPATDRVTHRRAGWAAGLSMSSHRISFYAYGNTENKRGWHTGSGMLYHWKEQTLGQFSDAFWPTVDPYRLPGTTVSAKTLADGAGGDFGAPCPTSSWVGGAGDGTFAVAGMDIRGLQSTLGGRKSWFFVDDAIVCLGAGIGCADGTGVESIVENRNLGSGGTHTLTVDGVAQPSTTGWSATLTGAGWANLAGFAGYVFPGGATVKALRSQRTGSYHDINALMGSTTQHTRRYLTLWFDHGVNPSGAGYAYILMPGADIAATAARAADTGWLQVLANSAVQQGVRIPSLGYTAVNFFGNGTVGGVLAVGPASVMIRESGNSATLSIANPTQQQTSIDVTWHRPVAAVVFKDATVTVLGSGSSLQLRVDTSGRNGRLHKITVTLA